MGKLVNPKECVLFGVEADFAGDVVETLLRSSINIRGSVLAGDVEWDMRPLDPVDVDSIPPEWLKLPCLVTRNTPGLRKARYITAEKLGFTNIVSIADPSAMLPESLEFQSGCYFNTGCAIGAQARLGKSVYVNRNASIGHHSVIDDFVSIGPGANLASSVHIEAGTLIGAGASVAPGVTIGSNTVVAGGASIHRDVPSNVLVAGNPFSIKKTGIAGHKGHSV